MNWLPHLSRLGAGRAAAELIPPPLPTLPELARAEDLPVLSAPDLWRLLSLDSRRAALQDLLAWPREDWQALCANLLDAIAERVQLSPASESHHHAYLGGLLVHSLDVAERCLRLRRGLQLPAGAGAERVNACAQRWTYAVLVCALLHDPGKVGTRVLLEPTGATAVPWSPFLGPPSFRRYRLRFQAAPYKLHAKASLALYGSVVPPRGQAWLAEDPECFEAVLGCLWDPNDHGAGVLGEILRQADGQSVAADIGVPGQPRLAAATEVPLHDRLMTALRAVVLDAPRNAPGSWVFVQEDTVWLVVKPALDAAVAWLRARGDERLPDRERLMDTLQEHRLALASPEGRATWSVRVTLDSWSQALRVLRFPVYALFRPGHRPTALSGSVELDAATDLAPVLDESAEAPATAGHVEESTVRDVAPRTRIQTSTSLAETAGLTEPERAEAVPLRVARSAPQTVVPGALVAGAKRSKAELVEVFLTWLVNRVTANLVDTNGPEARLHGHPDGLLLVSPALFRDFARCCPEDVPVADDGMGDWMAVQRALAKSKFVLRCGKGTIFGYPVLDGAGRRVSRLSCMVLLDPGRWFSTPPPVNPVIGPREAPKE